MIPARGPQTKLKEIPGLAILAGAILTFLVASWRARLSTGASREARVDNARFWLQSWRARLSTGASREAPVDIERFWLRSWRARLASLGK